MTNNPFNRYLNYNDPKATQVSGQDRGGRASARRRRQADAGEDVGVGDGDPDATRSNKDKAWSLIKQLSAAREHGRRDAQRQRSGAAVGVRRREGEGADSLRGGGEAGARQRAARGAGLRQFRQGDGHLHRGARQRDARHQGAAGGDGRGEEARARRCFRRSARSRARGDAANARAYGDARGTGVRALHYAMVSPTLVLLLAFLVFRRSTSDGSASTTSTYGQESTFVGFANYAQLFGDRIFWRAFWNTFFVVNAIVYVEVRSASGSPSCCPGRCRGKALIIAVILAPYAITESSGIVMWRYMFEPDVGMVSQLLGRAGAAAARVEHQSRRDAVPRRHDRDLASPAVHVPHSLRGADDGAEGRARGVAHRRRQRLAAVPPDHAAAHHAGDPDRGAVPLHLRDPHVRRGLAADRGRAGALVRGARHLPLPRDVQVPPVRHGVGDRLGHAADVAA